uniref:Putative DNA binding helix-turn helix protein n=1 Tax=Magnetococcus massalia (strain MO-1) TaxID=451514 RepID=A0A1S7LHS3_MAGMO|nr:putative DNA binding helix-turn helix protein [Candidatus Magnetococcus massalia]
MTPTTLAERVILARKRAGSTQKQLSEHVGTSQTAINLLEKGKTKRSRSTGRIAIACGVAPGWLEAGVGEMLPKQSPKRPSQPRREETIIVNQSTVMNLYGTIAAALRDKGLPDTLTVQGIDSKGQPIDITFKIR